MFEERLSKDWGAGGKTENKIGPQGKGGLSRRDMSKDYFSLLETFYKRMNHVYLEMGSTKYVWTSCWNEYLCFILWPCM